MPRSPAVLVTAGAIALALPWVVTAASGDAPEATPQSSAAQVTSAAAVLPAAEVPDPDDVPATPSATPSPADIPVVEAGSGRLVLATGGSERSGQGPLKRYTVKVEEGLGVDPAEFAAEVERTLADPRSWGADDRLSVQRVESGPVAFRVVLASPRTTDRLCRPLDTNGIYSCGIGDTAVINSMRWLRGADAYAGNLPEYRQYVVNHEVGHTLGHGHETCPQAGRLAPVMMQQTITIGKCRPSPWPYP